MSNMLTTILFLLITIAIALVKAILVQVKITKAMEEDIALEYFNIIKDIQ